MATARQQPAWQQPAVQADAKLPSLKIYNSLTKTKVPFVPIDPTGKEVKWYACGPTGQSILHCPAVVYAPAHS
jgi:cysteinyl-tRNA synthetase